MYQEMFISNFFGVIFHRQFLFPIYPQTLLLIYLETEGIFQALYISHLSGDQETGDKFQKLCISNLLRLETPYRNCLFPVYLELWDIFKELFLNNLSEDLETFISNLSRDWWHVPGIIYFLFIWKLETCTRNCVSGNWRHVSGIDYFQFISRSRDLVKALFISNVSWDLETV